MSTLIPVGSAVWEEEWRRLLATRFALRGYFRIHDRSSTATIRLLWAAEKEGGERIHSLEWCRRMGGMGKPDDTMRESRFSKENLKYLLVDRLPGPLISVERVLQPTAHLVWEGKNESVFGLTQTHPLVFPYYAMLAVDIERASADHCHQGPWMLLRNRFGAFVQESQRKLIADVRGVSVQ